MQEHSVLGQVALGYSPMIDRQRNVVATRLTVFPERADSAPDAAALLRAIESVWPAEEAALSLQAAPRAFDAAAAGRGSARLAKVSLNLAGEDLLRAVMAAAPAPHLMVEVPAFMAAEAALEPMLHELHGAGNVLLIKGRPLSPLPPSVLALFSHCIVDAGDDRRATAAPQPGTRSIATMQAGAQTRADIDAAFQRGAVAVLGWPWGDAPSRPAGRTSVPSDVNVVMELIKGVDRQDPVPKLEAVLRRDPTVAFRLMRYLNSPAFGLTVEINSFGHALLMLGYGRLKRWLALLLASSAKGAYAKAVMFAALRRGLLMEELGRAEQDTELRGEMFICGIFSLLDRLLEQPMTELLDSLPVPERVQQALRGQGGPFLPSLDLVRAIELESAYDIRAGAEALLLSMAEVNRALMDALRAARQLDG